MPRASTQVLRAAFSAALLLALAPAASAQQHWSAAYLAPDHWSIRAAQRLAALGAAPRGHDAVRGALTQRELGSLFEHAARHADPRGPAGTLARGYLEAFVAEMALRDDVPAIARLLRGSSLGAGYESRDGALRPGWGYEDGHYYGDWNDADAVPDDAAALATGTLQLTPFSWLAARGTYGAGALVDGWSDAHVAVRAGPVAAWGGRARIDWSAGPGDGIVVNDRAFDGAGLQTAEALRLPGFLGRVGPVHAELVVARVDLRRSCTDPVLTPDDSQPCRDAWFTVTRGSVAPHERVQLGVTRAVVFGGAGNSEVDAFALFSVLIGKHAGEASELDNQVVALDGSWRLPTERWVPARAYLEWGFEDSAGAWRSVPGIVAGIEVPAVPGLPTLAVALERVSFARSCCGNPIWYRSSVFHDGWVIDERPLGHRLGGHGSEWTLHAAWDSFRPRIALAGEIFMRERGIEGLFAETRTGESLGGALRLDATLAGWLHGVGSVSVDDGEDWRETRAAVALRAFL